MAYQIDQSGKIEHTNKDTVVAIANGQKFSLLLRAKDKRLLQDRYRNLFDKRRQFVYEVFSALISVLISKVNLNTDLIIDQEYPGNEDLIKLLVLKYSNPQIRDNKDFINFGLVGKSSPAHALAYKTFRKHLKPSKIISIEEIMKIIFP